VILPFDVLGDANLTKGAGNGQYHNVAVAANQSTNTLVAGVSQLIQF